MSKRKGVLAQLSGNEWTVLGLPSLEGVTGREWAKAEADYWNRATAEFKAMEAVVRAAKRDLPTYQLLEAIDKAVARLERLRRDAK